MVALPVIALLVLGQSAGTQQKQVQTPKPPLPEAAALLRDVADKLTGLKTLKGKFVLAIDKQKPQKGEFRLEKPRQFAITGTDLEQYYDGDAFVQFDKTGMVYQRDDAFTFKSLDYLTGYEAFFGLISPLEPTGIGWATLYQKDVYAITLKAAPDVAYFKVFVDPSTKLPLGWSLNRVDGHTASVKVSEQIADEPIAAESFVFKPPVGAKTTPQVVLTDSLLPVGTQVPNFKGYLHTGEPFVFQDFLGKSKGALILFWYADCEACKSMIATFRERIAPLRKQGLAVMTVNVGDDKDVISARAKDWQLDMPHVSVTSESPIVSGFKVVAFPTMYLIGPDGKVWMRSVGYDAKALDSGLDALGFKS